MGKTRIFEVPGEQNSNSNELIPRKSVSAMGEDYQMIDAHIEESMKKKIVSFEYVDFSKLLVTGKSIKEEEHQRLEIINRNSMSYISPVSDRDSIQVSSYGK